MLKNEQETMHMEEDIDMIPKRSFVGRKVIMMTHSRGVAKPIYKAQTGPEDSTGFCFDIAPMYLEDDTSDDSDSD
jgi:hypothetical protein